jgi:nitrogen fixation protein FixH
MRGYFMAKNDNDSGKYWPYLILGFIAIGLTLGFWTVRSAISMPVSESNEFQKKYQDADNNINEILDKQQAFNDKYKIEAIGLKPSAFKPKIGIHHKSQFAALQKKMIFSYRITDRNGKSVNDANVSFLLTRPQTRNDDQIFKLKSENGTYTTPQITLAGPGRYILRLKAQIGDAVGYKDNEAYLKP